MNLYAKLRELEDYLQKNGDLVFTTPYGKVRKITKIENGYIVYERDNGNTSKLDIDILHRDYFLLQDLGELTSKNLEIFNKRYRNGKKPCDRTTFMLLMEYFFGCEFIRGKKGSQSKIIW